LQIRAGRQGLEALHVDLEDQYSVTKTGADAVDELAPEEISAID
jgi:hypothetical protein